MPKYFVGIDVSLNTIDICVIDTEQKIIKQKRFTQNKEGFNEIFSLLHTLGNPQDLAIGIESTGNYHINILHFLNKKTYNVTLINPLLIKKFLQSTTLRKTKTDKISAKIIALYLLRNPDKIKKDTTYDTVKLLARECEKLAQEIAKLKNKIKQITFNIFTELTHKYNIFTKTLLEFLLEVPSARCARELGEDMFRIYYKRKREEGMKHKKAIIATANKLLRILFTLLIRKTTFCDIPHPESPPISVPIFHS